MGGTRESSAAACKPLRNVCQLECAGKTERGTVKAGTSVAISPCLEQVKVVLDSNSL